jgi:hypothetical protein
LVKEIKSLDDHCKSGKVHYAIDQRVDHHFATVDDLTDKLTGLSGKRAAGGRADLVLQFIGHGEDGYLRFDSALSAPEMAVLIANCRPTCVIFNACETFGIAQAVSTECAERGHSTVVGFWHTPVVNRACERLSKSLFPFISGWTDAAERDTSSTDAFLEGIGLARDRIYKDEEMKKMFPCLRDMPKLDTLPKELLLPRLCTCAVCAEASGGAAASGPPVTQQASPAVGAPLDRAQTHAGAAFSDAVREIPHVAAADDTDDVARGGNYKGSLKAFGDGDDWLHECWKKLFNKPTLNAVVEGQYRCFFSHSFDSTPGPSRAYYFESWPVGAAESIVVLLHVHYWLMPNHDVAGCPKSINVRRGWRVDRSELKRRADGVCHDPMPPPIDMLADVPVWAKAMKIFLHDPLKDAAEEKARACAAVDGFEHIYFCPEHDLWVERSGACVNGGRTANTVTHKRSMDYPGWDFTKGSAAYPLKSPEEYPGTSFEFPKVTSELVAAVLIHAEYVRTRHSPEPAKIGKPYDGNAAYRGGHDKLSACRTQAKLLAEESGDFE